jgi:hypothetical protein
MLENSTPHGQVWRVNSSAAGTCVVVRRRYSSNARFRDSFQVPAWVFMALKRPPSSQ